MVYTLFAIRDNAAGITIGPVITVRHQIEASRAFMQMALDPQTNIGRNPEDFSLHKIGTYNDTDMTLNSHTPELIITAQECIQIARRAKEDERNA